MINTLQRVALSSAVGALVVVSGVVCDPSIATADTSMVATAGVNVRSGPSLSATVIGGLANGSTIMATGSSQNGWTPVSYQGRAAFIYSQYLRQSGSAQAPPPIQQGGQGSRATTAYLNMRTGPGLSYQIAGVLSPNTAVQTTGPVSGNYTQILFRGQQLWVATIYLSGSSGAPPAPPPPVNRPAPPPQSGLPPVVGTKWTTIVLNVRPSPGFNNSPIAYIPTGGPVQITGVTAGEWTQIIYNAAVRWVYTAYLTTRGPTNDSYAGSIGLDRITSTARRALNDVRAQFPECATVYGFRPGDPGDHGSGKALDFMMTGWQNDSSLGDRVSNYLINNADRLGVKYVIWRQRIWVRDDARLGWQAMADRGSPTQNHMDHVHLSLRS